MSPSIPRSRHASMPAITRADSGFLSWTGGGLGRSKPVPFTVNRPACAPPGSLKNTLASWDPS